MADEKEEVEEKKGGISVKMLIIIISLVVVLLGGGGAAFFLLNGDAPMTEDGEVVEEVVPLGPAIYYSLDPKFVVSFHDQQYARFMQFSVDIIMHDEMVKEQIMLHLPAVRSSLLMMFGDQKANIVGTKEGKSALLDAITKDINETLMRMEGDAAIEEGVENAYFSSFIIQ